MCCTTFPEETIIWIIGTSKRNGPPQCEGASDQHYPEFNTELEKDWTFFSSVGLNKCGPPLSPVLGTPVSMATQQILYY